MANIFNSIPLSAPKRNAFALNHQVKLTCEMGNLVPIFMEPTIPGDRFKVSTEQLVRFAPLQAPIMSDVDVYVHFFFVPNRLLWNNWETFITGSKNGRKLADEEVPSPPFANIAPSLFTTPLDGSFSGSGNGSMALRGTHGVLQNGSLADYLGFQSFDSQFTPPTSGSLNFFPLDEMPFRAYQRVWFDYYRDENLSDCSSFFADPSLSSTQQDGLVFEHDGTVQVNTTNLLNQYSGLFSLRQRAWRKDYFTSALPFAQAGDDVLIPGQAASEFSFRRIGQTSDDFNSIASGVLFKDSNGTYTTNSLDGYVDSLSSGKSRFNTLDSTSSPTATERFSLNTSNFSVSAASSADEGTIRELRRAFAAQAFLERRAVGGTRYNEQILAFFGVRTSDGRLQRAQWLGGSKQPVVVSQVLQTSQTTTSGSDASPLGQPGGVAVSAGGRYIFDREFEEYGFIVGIMSIMPRATYMQGIPRKYQKHDVYDYYWPQFARIGEQEIKNSELFFSPNGSVDNDAVFGYTPRYAEYRFINSRVHGDFKDTLDFWHLGRDFASTPSLNESFITCRPSSRIYAYEDSDFNHLWVDCHINCTAVRPIPKYAEASPI